MELNIHLCHYFTKTNADVYSVCAELVKIQTPFGRIQKRTLVTLVALVTIAPKHNIHSTTITTADSGGAPDRASAATHRGVLMSEWGYVRP
jgi:hypothetical protein